MPAPSPKSLPEHRLTVPEVLGMLVHPDQRQLTQVLMLLRQGDVHITLSGEFPLAEGALAHGAIEGGHVRGKLLLRMPAADGQPG